MNLEQLGLVGIFLAGAIPWFEAIVDQADASEKPFTGATRYGAWKMAIRLRHPQNFSRACVPWDSKNRRVARTDTSTASKSRTVSSRRRSLTSRGSDVG
jgi:hypothetical protein